MISKADISRAMAAIARKRTKAQCKGGRPKKADRCTCGNHSREYSVRWNLKCNPERPMENVEQGSQTYPIECARAKAEQTIPDDETPITITGAHCDYSARGSCREHWFRMAWRNNEWSYISSRLVPVGVRSTERHQTTKGEVWVGEIIAAHDRGKPITAIALVVNDARLFKTDTGVPPSAGLFWLDFSRRRDGQLSITLPDKSTLVLPNPRNKA